MDTNRALILRVAQPASGADGVPPPLTRTVRRPQGGEHTQIIPTPRFFESRAVKLFPFRWWFLGIALGGFATLGIAPFALASPDAVLLAFRWLLPLITWSWGLLLVATWFHPGRGTLREGSPWFLGTRGWPARMVRACAVVFLVAWFFIPVVIVALWRVAA